MNHKKRSTIESPQRAEPVTKMLGQFYRNHWNMGKLFVTLCLKHIL